LLRVGAELRCEPWWLAKVTEIVLDFDRLDDRRRPAARQLVLSIEDIARNLPEARFGLARLWSRRGAAQRASSMLSRSPFARTMARHNSKAQALRTVAATTTAGVLVALVRGERLSPAAVSRQSLATLASSVAEVDDVEGIEPLLAGWLNKAAGAEDVVHLAAALVEQGHPRLGQRVLARVSRRGRVQWSIEALDRKIIALLGFGSDDEVLQAARQYLAVPAKKRATRDTAERYEAMVRRFALAGRPTLALRLARQHTRKHGQASKPLFVDRRGEDGRSDDLFEQLADGFDPNTLLRMAAEDLPLPSRNAALQGITVAIAGGRLALAKRWAQRVAARVDEPWRVWLEIARRAQDMGEVDLAGEMVRRAGRSGAPAGALACPRLALFGEGLLQDCVAGRPMRAIRQGSVHEFGDLAIAVARGVDPEHGARLLEEVAHSGLSEVVVWVGVLSMRSAALKPADRGRVVEQLKTIMAALKPATAQTMLVHISLDDLAALGLPKPGVIDTEANMQRSPNGSGNRNNKAYAEYLSNGDPVAAFRVAVPALARVGGSPAHALLDTLAACLWKMQHKDIAQQLQRNSLVAAVGSNIGGLPMVRMAEFMLARGQVEKARTMALLGLQKARMYVTIARARRVLLRCLRFESRAQRK
jgi:hypothetical protein